jgi:hypothetical protein
LHWHLEGLEPYYRQLLDSSHTPPGLHSWPEGKCVPIENGNKSILFVRSDSQSLSAAKPFAAWEMQYPAVYDDRGHGYESWLPH